MSDKVIALLITLGFVAALLLWVPCLEYLRRLLKGNCVRGTGVNVVVVCRASVSRRRC